MQESNIQEKEGCDCGTDCECRGESGLDNIERTDSWVKKALPEPDEHSCDIQFACKFEEEAEIVFALLKHLEANDSEFKFEFREAYIALRKISNLLREYKGEEAIIGRIINRDARIDLLDGLVDSTVTNVSVAHTQKFNISGAFTEVNDSNFSKFEDGEPVFYEDGKIKKGKDYRPPVLNSFI